MIKKGQFERHMRWRSKLKCFHFDKGRIKFLLLCILYGISKNNKETNSLLCKPHINGRRFSTSWTTNSKSLREIRSIFFERESVGLYIEHLHPEWSHYYNWGWRWNVGEETNFNDEEIGVVFTVLSTIYGKSGDFHRRSYFSCPMFIEFQLVMKIPLFSELPDLIRLPVKNNSVPVWLALYSLFSDIPFVKKSTYHIDAPLYNKISA